MTHFRQTYTFSGGIKKKLKVSSLVVGGALLVGYLLTQVALINRSAGAMGNLSADVHPYGYVVPNPATPAATYPDSTHPEKVPLMDNVGVPSALVGSLSSVDSSFNTANYGSTAIVINNAFITKNASQGWLNTSGSTPVISGIEVIGACLNIQTKIELRNSYISCPVRAQNTSNVSWGYPGTVDQTPAIFVSAKGTVIEDNTITCTGFDEDICSRNVWTAGDTIMRRNDMSYARGAVQLYTDDVVEENYLHSFTYGRQLSQSDDNTHNNAINAQGRNNISVTGNYVDARYGRVSKVGEPVGSNPKNNSTGEPYYNTSTGAAVGQVINGFSAINYMSSSDDPSHLGENYSIEKNYFGHTGRAFFCQAPTAAGNLNGNCTDDYSNNFIQEDADFGYDSIYFQFRQAGSSTATYSGSCNYAVTSDNDANPVLHGSDLFAPNGTHGQSGCDLPDLADSIEDPAELVSPVVPEPEESDTDVIVACETTSPLRVNVEGRIADDYEAWVRVALENDSSPAVSDARLEVGGSCESVDEISSSDWQWIGVDGTLPLASGNQEAQIHTSSETVLVDKVLFTRDEDCRPVDDGSNCTSLELSISLKEPLHGTEVSGDVTIEALLSEDVSGAEVSFFIDDDSTPVTTQTFSPYCLVNAPAGQNTCGAWDTTDLANGEHTIAAEVTVEGQKTRVTQTFTISYSAEVAPRPVEAPVSEDPTPVSPPSQEVVQGSQPTGDADQPVAVVDVETPDDSVAPVTIDPITVPVEQSRVEQSDLSQSEVQTVAAESDEEVPVLNRTAGVELPVNAFIVGESEESSSTVVGDITVAVPVYLLEDQVGAEIQYFIDGNFVGSASSEDPLLTIDSADFDNGSRVLSAQIIYQDGQEATVSTTISIQNEANSFFATLKNNLFVSGLLFLGTVVYLYVVVLFVYKRFANRNLQQANVLDASDPYPRQEQQASWIETLPGKIYQPLKSQYVARPVAVLAVGGIILANGFVFASILQSDPIYIGSNGFVVEAEDNRANNAHAIKSFQGVTYMELVPSIAPVVEQEPVVVADPDPVPSSDYESQLNRILSSSVRNTNNDNRPFDSTASVDLPKEELYSPWQDYGRYLTGLPFAGNFRVNCEFSHFAYDDPVVLPNKPNAAHLHMFFGNTHSNAFTDYNSLVNSGSSTCNGYELNRTSYWVPALLDSQGDARIPDRLLVYYKAYHSGVGNTQVYPENMQLVSGDAFATSAQPGTNSFREIFFRCYNSSRSTADLEYNPKSVTIPNCPTTHLLEMNVKFQTCWNGKDPSNYQDNASYSDLGPTTGRCPSSHPQKLPQMEYRVMFSGHGGQSGNWFLSSDVDPADGKTIRSGGLTIHGDWFGGWNREINKMWIDNCVNVLTADCNGGSLGDPRIMNNPKALKIQEQYTGPMKFSGRTILEELCDSGKNYSGPSSVAYCYKGL